MPPIDNEKLLDSNGKIKSNLRERVDFVFVNELIWQILSKLYEGGPELKFELPAQIESFKSNNKYRKI